MVNTTTGESETRLQIVGLQIWHLIENLRGVQAGCKKVQNIGDTNTHPSDTWASSTLLRVKRDAIK